MSDKGTEEDNKEFWESIRKHQRDIQEHFDQIRISREAIGEILRQSKKEWEALDNE
jgi:hypothetical protein